MSPHPHTVKNNNVQSPLLFSMYTCSGSVVIGSTYLAKRLELVLGLFSPVCYCAQANLVGKYWHIQDTTESPSSLCRSPHRDHLIQKSKSIDIDIIVLVRIGSSFLCYLRPLLLLLIVTITTGEAFLSYPPIAPHGGSSSPHPLSVQLLTTTKQNKTKQMTCLKEV